MKWCWQNHGRREDDGVCGCFHGGRGSGAVGSCFLQVREVAMEVEGVLNAVVAASAMVMMRENARA